MKLKTVACFIYFVIVFCNVVSVTLGVMVHLKK